MSNTTGNDVQAAYYTYLKSKTAITSLLDNSNQVKEAQWQGTDFLYPAVRISVAFYPGIQGCQARAIVTIKILSEEKSSNEATNIAGVIQNILHRHPFSVGAVKFFSVIVEKVSEPVRSIFAWESDVTVVNLLA